MKTNKAVIIAKEKCKACEYCTYFCPKKCLKLSNEFNNMGYHPVVLCDKDTCNGCGICYIVCPEYAIEVL